DFMIQLFGKAAYIFSIVLLSWGYQLIKYYSILFYRAIACFIATITGATLASVYKIDCGGIIGNSLAIFFKNSFATQHYEFFYTIIGIIIVLFFVSFAIAVRLDFSASIDWIMENCEFIFKRFKQFDVLNTINFLQEENSIRTKKSSSKETKNKKNSQKRKVQEKEYDFEFPSINLLKDPPRHDEKIAESELRNRADNLIHVLNDFGINGEITNVGPGPVVTLYELKPAAGIKSSRVIGLSSDIARYMSAVSARVAVIPGKNALGIELPNVKRQIVYLREILESNIYRRSTASLPIALGKDIAGEAIVTDLAKMPHLLIAGTTGSGKSVGINAMILSLLYKLSPAECKFIMIDPKMLELSVYDDIPHLLTPVVTDPKKAVVALKWAVKEMESRYKAMSKIGVRNIEGYNAKIEALQKSGEPITRRVHTGFDQETGAPIYEDQTMDMDLIPYIVIIVDEMADLMLVAGKDIEGAVQRLAQMARAAGIHLIMATQRPSVDVITGTIKANFPTRISFQVSSKIDSRTILGEQGAEQLLGQGDMLYMASGGRMTRIHCPFVSDEEVENITTHLKEQGEPQYITSILEDEGEESDDMFASEMNGDEDPMYKEALNLILREGKASTSFLQRHLKIGYNRAARIIDMMEAAGIVSSANHVGKREIIGR
ncbi:MAG: hypothetical protein IJ730_06160, partial [Alphaproteobacteria bacterium]|nr:hypothetical protein [Alphaproteobacteria bacterium]